MKSRSLRLCTGLLALALCALAVNVAPALALSPAVETLAASSIAEKGATLNGKVNPNGAETKMYFEYGTTTSYGSKTSEVSVGSGTTTLEKSQSISGLSAITTYHYRIVASNSSGTGYGGDKTFTTFGVPTIVFGAGTPEAGGEAATLQAYVNPNGQSTTYQFEYGTSSGVYTNLVPVPAGSAGSGSEITLVDSKATGLTPGTTYYGRISATNASGKATSSEFEFVMPQPSISKESASGIWRSEAVLNGYIDPHGPSTTYYFEYGTTTSYGSKTTSQEMKSEEAEFVSQAISGLKVATVYHYRLVATNSKGTHIGKDQMLTTLASAALYLKGGGEPLKTGTALKMFSTNLSFSSESGSHSCSEAEFSGAVSENPGAAQSVSAFKMQSGEGAPCLWKSPIYWIKYSTPSSITIQYAKNESEAFVRTSKFVLKQDVYWEKKWLTAECEYNLVMAGSFKTGMAEPTLSGATEVVATSGLCPGNETVSGKFVLTSGGTAVEAK